MHLQRRTGERAGKSLWREHWEPNARGKHKSKARRKNLKKKIETHPEWSMIQTGTDAGEMNWKAANSNDCIFWCQSRLNSFKNTNVWTSNQYRATFYLHKHKQARQDLEPQVWMQCWLDSLKGGSKSMHARTLCQAVGMNPLHRQFHTPNILFEDCGFQCQLPSADLKIHVSGD